eukprot:COSAG02_NODE_5_length_66751_cov_63.939148_17_plen_193_part_00
MHLYVVLYVHDGFIQLYKYYPAYCLASVRATLVAMSDNFGTNSVTLVPCGKLFGTKFAVVWYQTFNFGARGLHNIPWVRFVTVGARCCLNSILRQPSQSATGTGECMPERRTTRMRRRCSRSKRRSVPGGIAGGHACVRRAASAGGGPLVWARRVSVRPSRLSLSAQVVTEALFDTRSARPQRNFAAFVRAT